MLGKQLCISVLVLATMLGASAVAQDEKNEVGGMLGRIFISDQGIQGATYFNPTIHSGQGLTFDVEYARRIIVAPIYSLSGEVLFAYNPDEDLNAGVTGNAVVPTDYKELFITPAARVNLFPTTAVSPWVSFGAGIGHISQSSALVFGGNNNPGTSSTSAAIEMGVGLDVKVWSKLSIRGGLRDFWSGEPNFPLAPTGKTRQHNYFVGGGAFWRF
jgi:Outer membrane protein beta-barrel domain